MEVNITLQTTVTLKTNIAKVVKYSSVLSIVYIIYVFKAQVPFKVKCFVWTLAHRKINTNEVKQKKIPNKCLNPKWCITCKQKNEDQVHLFFQWPFALTCWNEHWSFLGVRIPFSSSIHCPLFLTILWSTWIKRKNFIFKN